jgi:hypothetical protein
MNALSLLAALAVGCSSTDQDPASSQPTLIGSWKHVSLNYSNCADEADNRTESCTGTAGECGVLTFTATTWSWGQTLPDGSVFEESGNYVISTNYIILSGGSSGPGTRKHSISGSTLSYTKTSLVFTNTSISTGCTHTETLSRHTQPFTPLG